MTTLTKQERMELQAMKVPFAHDSWAGSGHFAISGECNLDPQYGNEYWADYYREAPSLLDDFGVNPKITAVLDHHGLYAEWVNPGVLAVYDAM